MSCDLGLPKTNTAEMITVTKLQIQHLDLNVYMEIFVSLFVYLVYVRIQENRKVKIGHPEKSGLYIRAVFQQELHLLLQPQLQAPT